jgi:hypothetical protein
MPANVDLRVPKCFPFGKSARLELAGEALNLSNPAKVIAADPILAGRRTLTRQDALAGHYRPVFFLHRRK